MKSEPFLLLHLFSVCVAWQSSLTRRHREGHIFYCRQQKIPRLGLKTSNFKYSTDVNCISDAVTFFMLPVAYVTGRWHLSANFLYCGWTAAGLTGLWHRRCGLESHGQFRFSYNNVISRYCLAWKISLWKALCVLKVLLESPCTESIVLGQDWPVFATSCRAGSGGPVLWLIRARTVVDTDPLIILISLKMLVLASRWLDACPLVSKEKERTAVSWMPRTWFYLHKPGVSLIKSWFCWLIGVWKRSFWLATLKPTSTPLLFGFHFTPHLFELVKWTLSVYLQY